MGIQPQWMYKVPEWFMGVNVGFEIIFAFISLLLAFYSYKIYKLSRKTQIRLFCLAFCSIGLSYIVLSVLNLFILIGMLKFIAQVFSPQFALLYSVLSIYSHMLFFTLGLITLAYMTLKINSTKTFVLLTTILLISISFTRHSLHIFYLYMAVLFAFIIYQYGVHYWKQKKAKTFLVLAGYCCLFIGKVGAIFSVAHHLPYVISHLFEMAGYILLLVTLLQVLKK